jgi:hypothetical protein
MADLILDSGVLIAGERNDLRAWELKRAAIIDRIDVAVPAAALAQAWRGGSRSANLVRFMRGFRVVALDERVAKATGELCGAARTTDIADASIVASAMPDSTVVTTGEPDLRRLARHAPQVRVRAL